MIEKHLKEFKYSPHFPVLQKNSIPSLFNSSSKILLDFPTKVPCLPSQINSCKYRLLELQKKKKLRKDSVNKKAFEVDEKRASAGRQKSFSLQLFVLRFFSLGFTFDVSITPNYLL